MRPLARTNSGTLPNKKKGEGPAASQQVETNLFVECRGVFVLKLVRVTQSRVVTEGVPLFTLPQNYFKISQ